MQMAAAAACSKVDGWRNTQQQAEDGLGFCERKQFSPNPEIGEQSRESNARPTR
jgi:hypothetical protein